MSSKAELCRDFGTSGKVNLKEDLGSNQQSNEVTYTSPPLVFDDSKEKLLIVGGSIADNRRINPPSGVIRAFDLVTGKLKWAFDPAPKNMSLPVNTAVDGKFVRGTPNSWSVMTADLENGIIFIPMGNASPDYFGGQRHISVFRLLNQKHV
jgi:glucose dehydrogenase